MHKVYIAELFKKISHCFEIYFKIKSSNKKGQVNFISTTCLILDKVLERKKIFTMKTKNLH